MSSEDKTPEVEQQKKQEPEGEVSGLVLENYSFTTAAAIVGYVDRKVCVMMTDGRQLFGVLRVFDQYGSIVIQDTFERIYLPDNRYGEEYIGDLLIRGENLLMIGDLDIDKEDEPIDKLERIPFDDAKREQKQISVNAVKI
ncbi:Lsm1p CYBJADRAFT_133787, partial [Cyberlindnera jadinii NRRL Y-1542]